MRQGRSQSPYGREVAMYRNYDPISLEKVPLFQDVWMKKTPITVL